MLIGPQIQRDRRNLIDHRNPKPSFVISPGCMPKCKMQWDERTVITKA
jgi:hypothetical protein